MDEFMKTLLSLSVSGTLLLLLILGLKQLYKNQFSKHWQYYVWLIVALRFLLPFTPNTTVVGSMIEKLDTVAITNEIPANPNTPVPENKDNDGTGLIQIVVCVHWFNPFVCLLEKEVNKSCELSCDEKVISVLDDKARREYGDTLILSRNNF